ncbi:unnamed protein product [Caenorhabditis auriculariae]|uniref:Uncharacterized protein n=1 Tax=Caenorhabditis auriculariae TaxID=2777116 RepID=A0A8S1HB16_9PELO|nr:unnamed protein product [Caenorhabditis auriculariae]
MNRQLLRAPSEQSLLDKTLSPLKNAVSENEEEEYLDITLPLFRKGSITPSRSAGPSKQTTPTSRVRLPLSPLLNESALQESCIDLFASPPKPRKSLRSNDDDVALTRKRSVQQRYAGLINEYSGITQDVFCTTSAKKAPPIRPQESVELALRGFEVKSIPCTSRLDSTLPPVPRSYVQQGPRFDLPGPTAPLKARNYGKGAGTHEPMKQSDQLDLTLSPEPRNYRKAEPAEEISYQKATSRLYSPGPALLPEPTNHRKALPQGHSARGYSDHSRHISMNYRKAEPVREMQYEHPTSRYSSLGPTFPPETKNRKTREYSARNSAVFDTTNDAFSPAQPLETRNQRKEELSEPRNYGKAEFPHLDPSQELINPGYRETMKIPRGSKTSQKEGDVLEVRPSRRQNVSTDRQTQSQPALMPSMCSERPPKKKNYVIFDSDDDIVYSKPKGLKQKKMDAFLVKSRRVDKGNRQFGLADVRMPTAKGLKNRAVQRKSQEALTLEKRKKSPSAINLERKKMERQKKSSRVEELEKDLEEIEENKKNKFARRKSREDLPGEIPVESTVKKPDRKKTILSEEKQKKTFPAMGFEMENELGETQPLFNSAEKKWSRRKISVHSNEPAQKPSTSRNLSISGERGRNKTQEKEQAQKPDFAASALHKNVENPKKERASTTDREKYMKELLRKSAKERDEDAVKNAARSKLKQGDVVRNRNDRRLLMHGQACPCCQGYYDALDLSPDSKKKYIDEVSRHRYVYQPLPETPPHYWDVGIPSEEELQRQGLIQYATQPLRVTEPDSTAGKVAKWDILCVSTARLSIGKTEKVLTRKAVFSASSPRLLKSSEMKAEQQQAQGIATAVVQSSQLPPAASNGPTPGSTSEADLAEKPFICPEDVLRLAGITQDYLCKPSANIYDIEFTRFKIRDLDTEQVLFEIEKPEGQEAPREPSEASRYVRYRFSQDFLRLKHVGATVEFAVGQRPVNKFRMIERHFFKDRLLKSFDFEFGFCIPNSRNSCEHIYEFPQLTESLIEEMVANPYETRSDSFYFVDEKLIMHNKADYAYDG